MKKIILLSAFAVFCSVLVYESLNAFSGGIVNLTRRGGNTEGCTCHGFSPANTVNVIISGPSSVRAGDTAEFKLKITGGPLVRSGCNISAAKGKVILSPSDTSLQRLLASEGIYELAHKFAKPPAGDTAFYTFRYIAPNTPGMQDTIFANGNSVNFDLSTSGDDWNYASDKVIQVTNSINIRNISSSADNYKLFGNYPNPFNPSTVIKYSVGKRDIVSLKIFDIAGREIAELAGGIQNPGTYEILFDAGKYNLPNGVYFCRYVSGAYSSTARMMLLK